MEVEPSPIVHLTEKLQIDDVLFENPVFSVDPHDLNATGEEEHTNIRDEYSIEKLEPFLRRELRRANAFEKMKQRMNKLIPDGMVMKELVKEGYNEIPDYNAKDKRYIVEYYYAAYAENNDLPFDLVMPRLERFQKPKRIKIGTDSIIPGLEIALKSMKRSEKANFLIHPHLAYRDGQPPRIPKQATILFVVELLDIRIDNSGDDDYDEDRYRCPSLKQILDQVVKICESAKEQKGKGNNQKAIKMYRKAEAVLASAHFANEEEEKIGNAKYMLIYSNLAVCHSDDKDYRKVCTAFNNARYRDPGLAFRNIKLLYNSAKALRILGDHKESRLRIAAALKVSPRNPDLLREQENIRQSAIETRQEEVQRYKRMLGTDEETLDEEKPDAEVIEFINDIDEFRDALRTVLQEFKQDPESVKDFNISDLSSAELECFEAECRRQQVRIRKHGSVITLLADSF